MKLIVKNFSIVGLSLAAILICLSYLGCSNNSQSLYAIGAPQFQGIGSLWNIAINTNANFIEYRHAPAMGAGLDYVGISAYQSYTSGFNQLTVQFTGPQDNGMAPVGTVSTAVSVPNYAYIFPPYQTGTTVASLAPLCPANDLAMNFIKIRQPSTWATGAGNGDAFGNLSYSTSGNLFTINNDYNFDSSGNSTADSGSRTLNNSAFSCVGGDLNDNVEEMIVSTYGGMVHVLATDEIYLGLIPGATTISAANVAGNYSGYFYQSTGIPTTQPVSVSLAVSGNNVTGPLKTVSDVTVGTTSGTIGTLSLTIDSDTFSTGAGLSGMRKGTLGTVSVVCIPVLGAQNTTITPPATPQNILACNGSDNSQFYTLMLVSH